LGQLRGCWAAAFGVFNGDDEATLRFDAEVCLNLAEVGGDGSGVDEMRGPVFSACDGVDAFGDRGDGVDVTCALRLGLVLTALDYARLVSISYAACTERNLQNLSLRS
jgi:hypothetical protein